MDLKELKLSEVLVSKLRPNELNIQKRLTFFTLAVVIITTGFAGLFLIENSHREQLQTVNTELDSIIETVSGSLSDKASLALALVNSSQSNFSLFLNDNNQEIFPLIDKGEDPQQLQAVRELAQKGNTSGNTSILVRQVPIEGDLKLVVTTSIKAIDDSRNSALLKFLIYLLIASSIALVVLRRVINQDIARESAELKLHEKLSFEQRRRRMLLEFASDTSHELRTPLTVITGYLDLIRRRKTGQIDDETLDNLSKEATRLDRNISNLLTMLEVEAIEDESLHPINLSAILEEELDSFKVIESGREVTTEIAQGVWVIGSEELVLKLIRNILANIRRHTGSKCSVRTRLYIEELSAVFTIEDGGPLPADQSLNLDDYLTRFNSSRSFSKGGSGLGFNIMNKSIEKLSGTMELFASPMGGFGIKLQIPQL